MKTIAQSFEILSNDAQEALLRRLLDREQGERVDLARETRNVIVTIERSIEALDPRDKELMLKQLLHEAKHGVWEKIDSGDLNSLSLPPSNL